MGDRFSLVGRVALVTGAGRGIGRAIAVALGAAGAAVACAARSRDQVDAAAGEITAAGGRARALRLDVTRPAEIVAGVEEVAATLGPVDVLVNNAGVTMERKTTEVTDAEWDAVARDNLTAMFRIYGIIGVPRYAAYCASKAAVDGLTRSLAAEWARYGIQVNCLAPGYVNTDIPRAALADEKTRALFLSRIPARRIGKPEEVGALAVYLPSPASDLMTGQTVYLDGGQTMAW